MTDFKVDFEKVEEEKDTSFDSFKAPTVKTEKKEVSGEINISESLKDDENKKVKITFKEDDFIGDYVKKSTAEAPNDFEQATMLGEEKKQTLSEVKEEIKKAEEETKDTFTIDDYEMISEFIIDAIDWGGGSLLMYIAKDNTDTPYVLSVTKKQRLKKQLTRILIKMEVKFNFTALFIVSLILAYIQPTKKAFESRKIVTKAEVDLNKKKDYIEEKKNKETDDGFVKEEIIEPIKEDVISDVNENVNILTVEKDTKVDNNTGKVTRKRGRGRSRV